MLEKASSDEAAFLSPPTRVRYLITDYRLLITEY
jgi:hypothetical protein